MRHKTINILILALALTTQAHAQYCGYLHEEQDVAPCYDKPYRYDCSNTQQCCWWGGFSMGGEYLLWKPCVDDLDYAIDLETDQTEGSSTTNVGRYKFNKPNWENGFRIYAGIKEGWYDWNFAAIYTNITGSATDSTTAEDGGLSLSTLFHGGFLFDTDSITGTYNFRYQSIEGAILHPFCLKPSNIFTPFIAFQWINTRQKRESTLTDSTTTNRGEINWQGDYWGLGFRFGTEYTYDICNCLQLYTSGSAAVLAGEAKVTSRHRTFLTTTGGVDLNFKTTECLFVPGYNVTAGLKLKANICCTEWHIKIGYEFLKWHNLPTPRRYFNSGADIGLSTSQSGATLGFHGLVAGAGVTF